MPACGVRHTHDLEKAICQCTEGAAHLLPSVSNFVCVRTCLMHAPDFVGPKHFIALLLQVLRPRGG